MAQHRVCPWWLGYFLASPVRRLWYAPGALVAPHLRDGMLVLEPGPGMGFFTIELARLVGTSGRVVAVDIERKMLDVLMRRAAKAGVADRIEARACAPDSMGLADLAGRVDFVLACAVVHELPNQAAFFQEAAQSMKSGAALLLIETSGHVPEPEFGKELKLAAEVGLQVVERPVIRRSHAALLKKS
jgi:ubiquinone/menaquinone biosynthesis C-methylase UbiE